MLCISNLFHVCNMFSVGGHLIAVAIIGNRLEVWQIGVIYFRESHLPQ